MSLVDALGGERKNTKPMAGVVAGTVTNNQDPENQGRVKVTFVWMSDKNETDWAHIATLMGGPNRGTFFLPEVNDIVLVAFEQGDIHRPYVIGALWNGEDAPPADNLDGKNNIKKIRSRSGHEIIFEDNASEKKEKVEIHTNAGHRITLDDSAGKEKIEITDKTGSNKIVIDSVQNSMSLESAMQIKIKGNIVEIEGTTSLTLKSNAVLTIQGTLVKIN